MRALALQGKAPRSGHFAVAAVRGELVGLGKAAGAHRAKIAMAVACANVRAIAVVGASFVPPARHGRAAHACRHVPLITRRSIAGRSPAKVGSVHGRSFVRAYSGEVEMRCHSASMRLKTYSMFCT